MITYTNNLDIYPGNPPIVIKLSQYDTDFSLVFNLFSSRGTLTIASGTTAVFREKKPDGNVMSVDATIDITNKKVTLTPSDTIAKQITAIAGKCCCELSLQKNNDELNTANFVLLVEKAPVDIDEIPSDSVLRELYDVADRADEILEAAETVDAAVEELGTLIDPTLTHAGKAADAKATGDRLLEISEYIEPEKTYVPIDYPKTNVSGTTSSGIYYKQKADGTFLVNGTNSSSSGRTIIALKKAGGGNATFNLTAGKTYRLRGCPAGGNHGTYNMDLRKSSGAAIYVDNGDGVVFTPSEDLVLYCNICIGAGYTVNNVVFTPTVEEGIPDESKPSGYSAVDKIARNSQADLSDYSLMLNTAYILKGSANYEPELHRITFDSITVFGPFEKNDRFGYGNYLTAAVRPSVVDWSDSLPENLNYAKHILINSETRELVWYDRLNDDPNGLGELIAQDRKKWYLVCICYRGYVITPTGYTDAVITINGVDMNHIKNQRPIVESMYLKGLSKKNFGKTPTIICAGQSNAVGRTPRSSLPSYVTFPIQNAGICKSGSQTFSPLTYENYTSARNEWGFDLIAYHYISRDGNTFNVIKHAMGATSIDPSGDSEYHWTTNYEELDNMDHSLLYALESLTRLCVDNNNIDVKAIVWHQGEGDDGARFPTAAANYYKNFLSLVAYMRGFVGNPELPFICGTIPEASGQYDVSVDAAIRRVANDDSNLYLVDLKNAQLLDQYHLNASWCEYFGKKVHDYLIDAKIFTGTKINPSEPT